MKAHQEEMKSMREVQSEKMVVNWRKLETETEVYPEKPEANQEKTNGLAEHYMCLLPCRVRLPMLHVKP
jgi:hypothetical protein